MPAHLIRFARWAGFIPAAIGAALLAGITVAVFFRSTDPTPGAAALTAMLQAAAQGAAFTYAGAWVAPARRRDVAFLLATAVALLSVVTILQSLGTASLVQLVQYTVMTGVAFYVARQFRSSTPTG
jgi:hypothetical protein